MYSGGDSSGEGVNSHNQFNWQMTSQTSCNVNSGSIDWASLAQQWIQMKDSGAGLPEAPPPPIIGNPNTNFTKSIKQPTVGKFDEQGEADMEVEKDDEMQVVGFDHNTPPPPPVARWVPMPGQQPDTESYCPPQQNWPWPARVTLPPPILHVPITTGSLTPPMPKDIINSTTPPLQKPNIDIATMLPGSKSVTENVPMDAAKRKILPAWIREGLEKMEREKQKQLERTTKVKEPLSAGTAAVDDESDINNFKSMVKSSIMETEGESSGNEDGANSAEPLDEIEADTALPPSILSTNNDHSENNLNSGKTYEERIADMMIGVRKTLTELLLEVTNEEIVILANEAIRRRREKASSVQVIRKSAIPSITGKLGLEAYADSDSENSASDNNTTNDESKRSDDDYDSEEELKTNIRICQRAFAKTIEEIEDKIEASTKRDEILMKEHRKEESKKHPTAAEQQVMSPDHHKINKRFDKEIGEPLQPDKKSNTNGKRKKERTSRFSDNKDSRNRNIGTSFYQPPAMGSGSLPTQSMPGSLPGLPATNFVAAAEFKSRTTNSSAVSSPSNDKRTVASSSSTHKSSKHSSSSSSRKQHRRRSDSSSSSSDSSSSSTSSSRSRRSSKCSDSRRKRSSRERSKRSSHKGSHRSSSHRSSSHRSSRRRDSSESNDDDRYSKRSSSHRHHNHKSHSSSKYSSKRNDRRRSDSRSSRSRTRSRSRSRSTTYSSSRRGDRF